MKINKAIFTIFMILDSVGFAHAQSGTQPHVWGDIDYKGRPWTENISKPNDISRGLNNRHISLWASHGCYYDASKMKWQWQRPLLFCTNEDLFTQTIVVPFLIPMLENAGANVFTPRERDWQRNEVIVDNDKVVNPVNYIEVNANGNWQTAPKRGFAYLQAIYRNGENPFETGTVRMVRSTKRKRVSLVSYQPDIPESGRYAVYISYASLPNSVDDAEYTVYHKGEATTFKVNQRMGGGTWVYLGSFNFEAGCGRRNRVVVTNHSRKRKGVVTTDAVRFGGGMGNIQREGVLSNMPRCLEGSRYYAQWAGAPTSVYNNNFGQDDYKDDINSRSNMVNWLAGGSAFVPSLPGLKVPIEVNLAVHSDAGYARDLRSLVGSLAISTTNFNEGRLNSGISRMVSKDFAGLLLRNLSTDLQANGINWALRYLWDRNYSETRIPEIPSAILETLSHQNFPDMLLAQDPYFRFLMARSIYKTILQFVNTMHGQKYTVQPLAPKRFKIEFTHHDEIKLSWNPSIDQKEKSAKPTSYNVYVAVGNNDFDNGTNINSTSLKMKLYPGVQYNFRVTACNKGGESFPSETLSAYYSPTARKTVLVVNGFERTSSPAVVNDLSRQGFDLDADPGVSYGLTAGWAGRQTNFDVNRLGRGLGTSGEELAGRFVAGNDFNYAVEHVDAIAHSNLYNVVSCSKDAVLAGEVLLSDYDCIDLILGLEKNDGHSLRFYKTFTPEMQQILREYCVNHKALMVSGAYLGSDMPHEDERQFMNDVLKAEYLPLDFFEPTDTISGLGMEFNIYRHLNDKHYCVTKPESLFPAEGAFCAMQYSDYNSASVAYKGQDYRSFTLAFPFECIVNRTDRRKIMTGILNFLMN